ncbi:MAG: hypothetical protein P8129_24765, partial [Anaerolineae bacterium]
MPVRSIRSKLQYILSPGDLIPRFFLLGRTRPLAVLVLFAIVLLAGPLAATDAGGAQIHLAEAEQTEPPPPLRPEQVRFD